MPWKNGRGLTAEIDVQPSAEGSYLWRLSQATIQRDDPFSEFPGYDRWLVVWKGEGLFLNETLLEPLKPVKFSGEEKIFCRLMKGQITDIGLIFDRARFEARMTVVAGPIHLASSNSECVSYFFDLNSGDTLRVDGVFASQIELQSCLLVEISPRSAR